VVIHGHTISDEPEDCGNRIGIDTGAFVTGRLTALVLEGTSRRYIEAVDQNGIMGVRHAPPGSSPHIAATFTKA
jgi:serine/threonine protein phosphatase 1